GRRRRRGVGGESGETGRHETAVRRGPGPAAVRAPVEAAVREADEDRRSVLWVDFEVAHILAREAGRDPFPGRAPVARAEDAVVFRPDVQAAGISRVDCETVEARRPPLGLEESPGRSAVDRLEEAVAGDRDVDRGGVM